MSFKKHRKQAYSLLEALPQIEAEWFLEWLDRTNRLSSSSNSRNLKYVIFFLVSYWIVQSIQTTMYFYYI